MSENDKTITVKYTPGLKGPGAAVCGFGDPKIEVINIQNEKLSISDFYAIENSLRKGRWWPKLGMECVYIRDENGDLKIAETFTPLNFAATTELPNEV